MKCDEILQCFDQEQRIDIVHPGAQKERFPHLVRFLRPAPAMSYILWSRLPPATADAEIAAQVADLSARPGPFTWKVFAHDRPADLPARLVAHGFAPDDDPAALMVLELAAAPATLLAPVGADIRRIAHRDGLDDVIRVEAQVWGGSFDWIRQRLGDHLEIPGYLSVYVAYVDGEPAASGWSYFHPNSQFAGLWGGSTVAAFRQRGLYTALLATRVQEARARGYRFLTIEAGPMSRPIVARHGFHCLTELFDYEWRGVPRGG